MCFCTMLEVAMMMISNTLERAELYLALIYIEVQNACAIDSE